MATPLAGKDVIERVRIALNTDEEATTRDGQRIADEYSMASPEGQRLLDRVFIELCGWSLRSLLLGREIDPSYNPYHEA